MPAGERRRSVSTEENKAIVRRFVEEVQNGGNIDAVDELCSPEFVNHTAPPGVLPDCEGVKMVTAMFRRVFPDSYITVEDMVAEGDKVATRKAFRGTHRGEFMGVPPTGREVSISLIEIVRVVGGRVVEHWAVGDNLGMMRQLGVPAQSTRREPAQTKPTEGTGHRLCELPTRGGTGLLARNGSWVDSSPEDSWCSKDLWRARWIGMSFETCIVWPREQRCGKIGQYGGWGAVGEEGTS